MNISFSITAMVRPEILKRTLKSFSANIKGLDLKECDVFINVDPIPGDGSQDSVVDVASSFFGNVIASLPKKPNFTKAVNWCLATADSDYLFHLEDDWELVQKFDIINVMKKTFADKRVQQLALRAYSYPYNKVCLSPSIMKKELYKSFVDKFDLKINPEIQLRPSWVNKSTIVAYPSKRIIVKDIGRLWIKKSGYKKSGDKKFQFIKWEEK
jgi:hypothetical protein